MQRDKNNRAVVDTLVVKKRDWQCYHHLWTANLCYYAAFSFCKVST